MQNVWMKFQYLYFNWQNSGVHSIHRRIYTKKKSFIEKKKKKKNRKLNGNTIAQEFYKQSWKQWKNKGKFSVSTSAYFWNGIGNYSMDDLCNIDGAFLGKTLHLNIHMKCVCVDVNIFTGLKFVLSYLNTKKKDLKCILWFEIA